MPATIEAPRSAAEAAHQLAKTGAHVHLVSDGHSTCVRGACGKTLVQVPAAVQEQARLSRIALSFEIRRI